ncbi:MAG TPA: c-type cytochrome biogenesis protein CcsB [Bacteroidales bacterium]|nr:c-type cytochrome biogenesis protein CcsB [Bacteroidales bacterium]
MRIFKFLASPVFMGVLFIIFAVSLAVATFIENDYGSAAAYDSVYDTRWFEFILLLLAINLIGMVIMQKLYRRSKITVFMFHMAFVVILAGAAITRYFGWEGSMHIREGEEQSKCYSGDRYIGFELRDTSGRVVDAHSEKYSMSSHAPGRYREKLLINGLSHELVLSRIIANATESVTDDPDGEPLISIVATDNSSREKMILRRGDIKVFGDVSIGFFPAEDTRIKIMCDSSSFFIQSESPVSLVNMMTGESQAVGADVAAEIKPMQIIALENIKLVVQKTAVKGSVKPVPADRGAENTGTNVFIFSLMSGNKTKTTINVWDSGMPGMASGIVSMGSETLEVFFGSREKILPFSIYLNDFVLERYPGSNSPSGYRSDVLLKDKTEGVERSFVIFMNNVLKYRGFRFYQSSYDPDEQGTILSVNNDPAGMIVTYTGYGILFLFIILSLLNRKSLFHSVNPGFWNSALRKRLPLVMMLIILTGKGMINGQKLVPDRRSAEEFGKILVQDQKGRTEPLSALGNDILRKVARENKFEGLDPMQVYLGLYLDFDSWKDVPLIKVSNKELQGILGLGGSMAAFSDIVNIDGDGTYKLSDLVNKVYSKAPGERSKLDKEIMKVDERVNIVYMIYTGGFLKIFPKKDGQHDWDSPQQAVRHAAGKEDSLYLHSVMPMFAEALRSGNRTAASAISASIVEYQQRFAGYDLPPVRRINAEILYYKLMIFERLFPFYATIGIIMLVSLLIMVIGGIRTDTFILKALKWLLLAGFILHTFGIGLRWYVSGHSPMSNGYESMIFISWVTLFAGFIFSRKSDFTLSATAVLASMTLMVAHLSFMDPEITNLVPVLKSYWLTLHVSVITGSYGFLGLGAILGIINLILVALSGERNRERISATVDELTVINYKTLTIGLYLLTIGTFLGAVWANESWGRYWGWDPKETWSLITIVVYTLVTHSRMIPGLKDIYSFNLLSMIGFFSVLMTYFGVNYYLSGLHSYAGGDPVPVPAFVYVSVVILALLSVTAYMRYRKWEKGNG